MGYCKSVTFIVSLFALLQFSYPTKVQNGETRAEKVIFCYYGSWATYRPEIAQFNVEHINASLCTHIIYTFTGLKDGVITSLDEYNDYEENWGKGSLKRFANLAKSNGIKAILAIGGWNEGSVKYSQMAATQPGRDTFADSVVTFLQKYDFDGLDLDWEYPTQRGGSPEDKDNLSLLLETLSDKLHAEGLMLTVAVCADPTIAEEGYDFREVAKYADFISLMSFDYHTATSDNVTGLNSPLHALSGANEIDNRLNVEYSVNQWLNGGVPASKLNLGIPLYGRTYILANPEEHGLGAPVNGSGTAGPHTKEDGFLSYYEICLEEKWIVVTDDVKGYSYAYYNNNWVSYDDIKAVIAKAQFVMDKGLAGAMMWALESEDFHNLCGKGAFPLVTAVNKEFGRL